MKFWVKFSRSIFKLAVQPRLKKMKPKLLEAVLARSPLIIDVEMVNEIRSFVISQQTTQGGFADRGGKSDLYYSLFGLFVAEAFSVSEVFEPLRKYVAEVVSKEELSGVYRYCGAILYAKLMGLDANTEKLRIQIVKDLKRGSSNQPEYSSFLGILSLYYLEDYLTLQRIVNQYNRSFLMKGSHPCPVTAANEVILSMASGQSQKGVGKLLSFHRQNGGFAALHRAPAEDLLSTGVALFALNFLEADYRLIKPDCLNFVDDLYDNGGFRSTHADSMTDVEYTFYGLLALGSMN